MPRPSGSGGFPRHTLVRHHHLEHCWCTGSCHCWRQQHWPEQATVPTVATAAWPGLSMPTSLWPSAWELGRTQSHTRSGSSTLCDSVSLLYFNFNCYQKVEKMVLLQHLMLSSVRFFANGVTRTFGIESPTVTSPGPARGCYATADPLHRSTVCLPPTSLNYAHPYVASQNLPGHLRQRDCQRIPLPHLHRKNIKESSRTMGDRFTW